MAKKRKRTRRKNSVAAKISGWLRAKAVKIVRNKKGEAVSVRIKT